MSILLYEGPILSFHLKHTDKKAFVSALVATAAVLLAVSDSAWADKKSKHVTTIKILSELDNGDQVVTEKYLLHYLQQKSGKKHTIRRFDCICDVLTSRNPVKIEQVVIPIERAKQSQPPHVYEADTCSEYSHAFVLRDPSKSGSTGFAYTLGCKIAPIVSPAD